MEEDGEELKGSARSIGGFNIIEALTKCSDLLIHFGGHAFAAGFKLKKEHFVLLEDRLIAITNKEISEQQLKPEIVIDKRISNKNIEQKLMQEVKQLEPFGSKNFPPIFAVLDEEIIESRLVGNPAKHLKIAAKDSTGYLKGIAFNYGDKGVEVGESASIAFYLEENIWNGNTSIEARVVDIKLNK
jgi:single-stranded-DNA-specific exonuclease